MYRRILGPVYDNRKKNYANAKNHTIIETKKIDYVGLGIYREWKKIEFPKGYV